MEPRELSEMISRAQAEHARLHEIWHALNDTRKDNPLPLALVNSTTSTISAHLDALYAIRVYLNESLSAASAPFQRGA